MQLHSFLFLRIWCISVTDYKQWKGSYPSINLTFWGRMLQICNIVQIYPNHWQEKEQILWYNKRKTKGRQQDTGGLQDRYVAFCPIWHRLSRDFHVKVQKAASQGISWLLFTATIPWGVFMRLRMKIPRQLARYGADCSISVHREACYCLQNCAFCRAVNSNISCEWQ